MIEALNRIYNLDCIEGMERLYKKYGACIDLVVTDCPYKIISGGATSQKGGLFDNKTFTKGQVFKHNDIKFADWLPHVYNLLKDGTHFYVMVNDKNVKEMLLEATKVGFQEVNILVWKKNNSLPNRYYMKNLEFILLFRKGKARTIHNAGDNQVLEYPNIIGSKVHPSQKPIELMKRLIENSSNTNEIILDPFMGSGTTALAAIESNRQFIGFELDKQYYDLTNERIKAYEPRTI